MQDPSSPHPSTGRPVWLLPGILLLFACSSVTPRREPLGERFPAVRGETLDGATLELPGGLLGKPSILLIGYVMEAQFDIDRWLLGLLQLETPVRLLEVPTIDGMVPGLIAGTIDNGMRSGIPPQDWATVVTLYGDDADRVVALTGDAGSRNARVLLLDADGRIVWYADRGWSAKLLLALDARARDLAGAAAKTTATHETLLTDRSHLLFDFSTPEAVERFAAVDDRVMGGRSQSTLRSSSGIAAFEGELSLEQNGGFAAVRSDPAPIDLSNREGIALHVRGDGRTYKFRLRTDDAWDGVSYQSSFATTPGAWTTIHLPFEAFQPTYRGQAQPDAAPLAPAAIVSFGLLLADDQAGTFRLEIGWMSSYSRR